MIPLAVTFDVTGPMAMFRRPYTTTSSVSFPFPPPTAIAGLIGAICGFDNGGGRVAFRADYWDKVRGCRVGLRILRPGRIGRYTLNFSNTKDPGKSPRIQVKHQLLLEPSFRIYLEGPLEDELSGRLERGEFAFTPYLGVAYAMAEISYVGRSKVHQVGNFNLELDSVLPFSEGLDLDILSSEGVFKERVPLEMSRERAVQSYIDVLFAPKGRRLHLRATGDADVVRCGEDTVAWFPRWL